MTTSEVSSMRQRDFVLLAIVVVSLVRPIPAQKATTPAPVDASPAYTVSEAYAVYASILEARSQYFGEFVVGLETQPYEMCRAPDGEPDTSIRADMVDYVKVNHSRFILLPIFFRIFPVSKPYRLVLRQDLKPVDLGIGFLRFGGPDLWTFSAVGFSRDKTVALTYYEHSGSGQIMVLQKIRGKWTELGPKAMCGWMA
jgi:hypothetical protein